MDKEQELRPCPLCNAALSWDGPLATFVHPFDDCHLSGHFVKVDEVSAWNRRSPDEQAEVVGWTGRRGDYPLGTRALSIDGGHWTRVEGGWKWHLGDVFPSLGADAYKIEIPASPPAVARLLAMISSDDHRRGCQGREYSCTCGYDDRKDAALAEAAAAIERLVAERDEARALVAEANNSLYGSQGYFHSVDGGPFDKHHLSSAIEAMKARGNRQWTALFWIAHTFTEDSHGGTKCLPAHEYQARARQALGDT